MSYFIISLFFIFLSEPKPVKESVPEFDWETELNAAIFDGFYDNDSTKIDSTTYFVK